MLVTDTEPAGGFDWRAALARLWPRRLSLAAIATGGALVALGASFLLPPVYEAGATLMEAQSAASGSPLDQLGLAAETFGLRSSARASGASTYPEIVRSRRLLATLLAQRFPTASGEVVLLDRLCAPAPAAQRLDSGVRRLRKQIDAALDRRTGILTLHVRMNDPVLAAGVANGVCVALQDIVVNAMTSQAGANRRFIEGRLRDAQHDLARAEDQLRSFRENNLRGASPRLLTEDARLQRVVRVQEEILMTLTRQYEIAGVDEQRDVPVINVLDPAVPPAFRSAPRRSTLAVLGLLLGFVGGAVWVLCRPPGMHAEPILGSR